MKLALMLTLAGLSLASSNESPTRSLVPRQAGVSSCSRLAKPTFMGVKKCKVCHFLQWKGWKKTRMSQAFETLLPGHAAQAKAKFKLEGKRDYTQDASCLACHTTGYGLPGGYPALVKGKTWTEAESLRARALQGVQCEACHGPGSLSIPYKRKHFKYKRADVRALGLVLPDEKTCRKCHNRKSPAIGKDYRFDFKAFSQDKTKVHEHRPLRFKHD